MTVIAWDGKSLAVDKMVCIHGLSRLVSKYVILDSGEVAVWTGANEEGLMLAEWYNKGADPKKWPKFQSEEDFTNLIIIGTSGIKEYERQPIAQLLGGESQAWGSGRDYALGAMAAGATSEKAVDITSRLNVYCGKGIDSFRFVDGKVVRTTRLL